MGAMYLFDLNEICKKCGKTNYEFCVDHGQFFVYCPTCDKSWEPCKSAWDQYKAFCGVEGEADPYLVRSATGPATH